MQTMKTLSDQPPPSAASDLGMHSLPIFYFPSFQLYCHHWCICMLGKLCKVSELRDGMYGSMGNAPTFN